MIDVQAARERLNKARQKFFEAAKKYGVGSEEARQAFVDMSMAVYGNARQLETSGE